MRMTAATCGYGSRRGRREQHARRVRSPERSAPDEAWRIYTFFLAGSGALFLQQRRNESVLENI